MLTPSANSLCCVGYTSGRNQHAVCQLTIVAVAKDRNWDRSRVQNDAMLHGCMWIQTPNCHQGETEQHRPVVQSLTWLAVGCLYDSKHARLA